MTTFSDTFPLKVLYIVGAGRSGSTLLDRVIGQLPRLSSTGELHSILSRSDPLAGVCGCRAPMRECVFWPGVIGRLNIRSLDEARKAYRLASRVRNYVTPGLSHANRAALKSYAAVVEQLYLSVARETQSWVVIDSSKTPGYAGLASLMTRIDMYMLHLVRDPRAVAYSWQRRKTRPDFTDQGAQRRIYSSAMSSFRWTATNLASELIGKRFSPRRRWTIRYEDLASEPEHTLDQIQLFLGLPVERIVKENSSIHLSADHTAGGNLNRFIVGEIQLKLDDEWRSQLSRRDRFICTATTLPLLKKYRYL